MSHCTNTRTLGLTAPSPGLNPVGRQAAPRLRDEHIHVSALLADQSGSTGWLDPLPRAFEQEQAQHLPHGHRDTQKYLRLGISSGFQTRYTSMATGKSQNPIPTSQISLCVSVPLWQVLGALDLSSTSVSEASGTPAVRLGLHHFSGRKRPDSD